MGCCSSKTSPDDTTEPAAPHDLTTIATRASLDRIHSTQETASLPNAAPAIPVPNQRGHRPWPSEASTTPGTPSLLNHRRNKSSAGTSVLRTALNPAPPPDKIKPPPNAQIVTSYAATLPPVTRAQLEKERRDFFDTRVSGKREVWGAMKYVCELVERGELEAARAVLEAAGCSCPSGDLHGKRGGAYDERGTRYVVPAWLLGEPAGTVRGASEAEKGASEDEDDEDLEVEKEEAREMGDKGKGRAVETPVPVGKLMAVRARLSNTGRDVVIRFREGETVGSIAGKIRQEADMAHDAGLKIMYLGKPLLEDRTLEAQGWQKDNTIIVFVFG